MKKTDNSFSVLFLLLIFVFISSWTVAREKNRPLSQLSVTDSPGFTVPENFTGISFETDAALPNHHGVQGYFFSSANKQLITLFINSGIRSLRIGGGTVDIYHEAAYNRNQWLKTCTIYMGPSGEYLANPKAHAIKAFDLVSGGRTEPVAVSNPEGVNLTAYAVKRDDYLYVTIINKEHGSEARGVQATISAKGFTKGKAEVMFLLAPGNNAGATNGVTLGGDSITNNRPWHGKWTVLKGKSVGQYDVNVAETSAVVVRIPLTNLVNVKDHA
jgi:hypothetical protein